MLSVTVPEDMKPLMSCTLCGWQLEHHPATLILRTPAQTTCGVEKDLMEKVPDTEASVANCLQDNRCRALFYPRRPCSLPVLSHPCIELVAEPSTCTCDGG